MPLRPVLIFALIGAVVVVFLFFRRQHDLNLERVQAARYKPVGVEGVEATRKAYLATLPTPRPKPTATPKPTPLPAPTAKPTPYFK